MLLSGGQKEKFDVAGTLFQKASRLCMLDCTFDSLAIACGYSHAGV